MQQWIVALPPWKRVLMALLFAGLAAGATVYFDLPVITILVSTFTAFALGYNLLNLLTLMGADVKKTRELAEREDGMRGFMLIMITIASFACIGLVAGLLMDKQVQSDPPTVILGLFGMMMGWGMVHTLLSFHYAYLFHKYQDDKALEEGKDRVPSDAEEAEDAGEEQDHPEAMQAQPMEFPGMGRPDYFDFMYFSFAIGCAFAVSDVRVQNKRIRRIALLHSVLAFFLNAFVLALGIDLLGKLAE